MPGGGSGNCVRAFDLLRAPLSVEEIERRRPERLTVSEGGNVLTQSITVTDPVVFRRPYTLERTRTWMPGYEISPYNCVVEWEDPAD